MKYFFLYLLGEKKTFVIKLKTLLLLRIAKTIVPVVK